VLLALRVRRLRHRVRNRRAQRGGDEADDDDAVAERRGVEKTLPVIAMPAAEPMRWAVCRTPPALPARSTGTCESDSVWLGERARPSRAHGGGPDGCNNNHRYSGGWR
jgi:hypothetical protein